MVMSGVGYAGGLVDPVAVEESGLISREAMQEAKEVREKMKRSARALRRAALMACRPPEGLVPPPPLRCAACELTASIHARDRGALSATAPPPPASDAEAVANALLHAAAPGRKTALVVQVDVDGGSSDGRAISIPGGGRRLAERDAKEMLASAPEEAVRRLPAPLRARLGLPLTLEEGHALRAAGISEAALRREGRRLASRFEKGEADTSSDEDEDEDEELSGAAKPELGPDVGDGVHEDATDGPGAGQPEILAPDRSAADGGGSSRSSRHGSSRAQSQSSASDAAHFNDAGRGSSLYQRAVEVLAHAGAGSNPGAGLRTITRARKYHVHVMEREDPHAPPLDAGLSSGSISDSESS